MEFEKMANAFNKDPFAWDDYHKYYTFMEKGVDIDYIVMPIEEFREFVQDFSMAYLNLHGALLAQEKNAYADEIMDKFRIYQHKLADYAHTVDEDYAIKRYIFRTEL